MNFWVYILKCENKNPEGKRKRSTFYVGSTSNLERRLEEHKKGKSWYTSKRKVKFVYCETQPTRKAAYKREFQVKRFTRKEKENLIKTFDPIPKSAVINI